MNRKRGKRDLPTGGRLRPASRRKWWLLFVLLLLVVAALGTARPGLVRYRLWRAGAAFDARNTSRALAWLESAEHLEPQRGETQFWLARVSRRMGRYGDTQQHLRRAAQWGYSEEVLRREELLTLVQAGQLSPADPQVTALLQNPSGDSLEIYEVVTRAYIELFELNTACLLLDGWMTDFPRDPQPHLYLGLIHAQQEEWPQAAAEFRAGLRLDARRDDLRLQLADALREQYRYSAAMWHYQQCLTRSQEPAALLGVGLCHYGLGDWEKAREALTQGLARRPEDYDARLTLGELELTVGQATEALKWLTLATKQKPYDFQARRLLAWALVLNGLKDQAREHFQFAADGVEAAFRMQSLNRRLKVDPQDVECRCELGAIFLEFGQPDRALGFFRSVLHLQPNHRRTHQLLARLYEQQGNRDLAAEQRRLSQ